MQGFAVVALLVTSTGCDKLFGVDRIEPGADAAGGCFEARVELPGITNATDPTLRADRLEVIYVQMAATGSYELFHTTRPTINDAFANAQALTMLNSSAEDTDPALTADGLVIVFRSTRNATQRLYQSKRATISSPWAAAALVSGLEMKVGQSVDLSPDGLTIYFDSDTSLKTATRGTVDEAFTAPVDAALEHADFPSVSPDGLELYFNAAGILRRTRASKSDLFSGTPQQVDAGGFDADLTSDGQALVLVGGLAPTKLYTRARCP